MEEKLASKDLELNTKAQEVLKLETQMCEDQDQLKSLCADLLQKKNHISYLHTEMFQGSIHADGQQTEVTALTGVIWELRGKLHDAEGERNRPLSALWSQEQTVKLRSEQVGSQKTLHKYQETCQLLLDKDKLIQELLLTLEKKERARVEQERRLDARLKEIRSLREKLGKLDRGTRESGTACGPDPAQPRGHNKQDATGRWTRDTKLEGKSGGRFLSSNKPERPKEKDQMTKQPQQETCGRVQLNVILMTPRSPPLRARRITASPNGRWRSASAPPSPTTSTSTGPEMTGP
ncbi:uncharacterized protein LOC143522943 isoform X2 [Brachyhypopomus gauderio]|uniref:uncharacterized protein LOC143522943 isoform X2 n=1 Tax=Brachyhypopomus gauderio TaxID=698409 RepID=UPI0040435AAC